MSATSSRPTLTAAEREVWEAVTSASGYMTTWAVAHAVGRPVKTTARLLQQLARKSFVVEQLSLDGLQREWRARTVD